MQDDQYHRGLATRRQVMGDDFVDRALAGATPFSTQASSTGNRSNELVPGPPPQ